MRTSCSSGAFPATLHSPASGSSNKDAATARCAATASSPDHRATHAARAAARMAACTSEARCRRATGARWQPLRQNAPRPQCRRPPRGSGVRARARGIGLVAFASRGAIRLGTTRPHHGADDGGINGLLRAMPPGQPVRDNVDAAVIADRNIDVHVGPANVAGDPRPGFLAHPRLPAREEGLGRLGSRCEHTGGRTCSPVVAQGVRRPRPAHVRGATGRGRRSRRSSNTRKRGDGTVKSNEV